MRADKFLSSEYLSDISCECGIRIFLRRPRNEQDTARYAKAFRIGAECFPQQPLDAVAYDTFAIFFTDTHRKTRLVGGHPDDRQTLRVCPFPNPQDFRKVLCSLDPQVLHGALSGNVLSALVSSSLDGVSSALRLHAHAESVNLVSLTLLGLIRSLHNNSLYAFLFARFSEFL